MSETYETALARYTKMGAANADDTALMAGFCEHLLQPVVGAVSPKLVFTGALESGLTSKKLADLAVNDARAVEDLMWI